MITLEQLVAKYNGKPCEVGGSAGAINQCVDLANAYIQECLGEPILLGTNAVDFPERIGDKYDFVANTPDGMPLRGDIIVFKQYGTRYGVAGHIAIVLSATVDTVEMFEQNYPTGSLCTTHSRNYLGCRGWLRYKGNPNIYKGLDLTNTDSMKAAIDVWADLMAGRLKTLAEFEQLQKQIGDLENSQKDLAERLSKLEGSIATKDEQIASSKAEAEALKAENQTIQEKLDYYQPYKALYEKALANTVDKYTGVQLISMGVKKMWAERRKK